jgi:hypothetical protein
VVIKNSSIFSLSFFTIFTALLIRVRTALVFSIQAPRPKNKVVKSKNFSNFANDEREKEFSICLFSLT